jgi:GTP 3',8-cyclase
MGDIRRRCDALNVLLSVKRYDEFQRIDPENAPHGDADAVFAGCWMRHRCNMVRDGVFYSCTRPPAISAMHGLPEALEDGLALEPVPAVGDLIDLLDRPDALVSCSWCLGSNGPWLPHQQTGKGSP